MIRKFNIHLQILFVSALFFWMAGCQSAKRLNLKYTDVRSLEISSTDDNNKTLEVKTGEVLLEHLSFHYYRGISLPEGIKYGFEEYPPQSLLLSSVEDDKFQYFGPVIGGPYKVHFGLQKGGGESAIWWEESIYNVGEVKWVEAFVPDLSRPINAYKVSLIDSTQTDVFLKVEHYNLLESSNPTVSDMKIVDPKKNDTLLVGDYEIRILGTSKHKAKYTISRISNLGISNNFDKTENYQSKLGEIEQYRSKLPSFIQFWSEAISENKTFLERLKSIDRKSHVMNSTYDNEFYQRSYELGNSLSKQLGNYIARKKYGSEASQWVGDKLY